jgi:hypothetical protein
MAASYKKGGNTYFIIKVPNITTLYFTLTSERKATACGSLAWLKA